MPRLKFESWDQPLWALRNLWKRYLHASPGHNLLETAAKACLERVTFRERASEAEVLDRLRTFVLATFPSTYLEAQLVRVGSNHPNWILEDTITDNILEQIDRILAAQKQTK